jgi:hypothetical protein
MSDISEVIAGLNGDKSGIIFALVVLTGGYFLFKQTFGTLVNTLMASITEQLKNITEELRKTRETLMLMQTSQSKFDSRLEKLEDDVKRGRQ